MTAPEAQVARNAAATRWLADLLERLGLTGDVSAEAEHITRELLAQGIAPVPKPVPLRPTTPASTPAGRAAARAIYEQARADARHDTGVNDE